MTTPLRTWSFFSLKRLENLLLIKAGCLVPEKAEEKERNLKIYERFSKQLMNSSQIWFYN
jgi:hypothetical protein